MFEPHRRRERDRGPNVKAEAPRKTWVTIAALAELDMISTVEELDASEYGGRA